MSFLVAAKNRKKDKKQKFATLATEVVRSLKKRAQNPIGRGGALNGERGAALVEAALVEAEFDEARGLGAESGVAASSLGRASLNESNGEVKRGATGAKSSVAFGDV